MKSLTALKLFIVLFLSVPAQYLQAQSNPLNTALEVGTTPGSFAVSQTRGATYTIPLTVPPCTGE